jgi:hypothetical protein
LTSEADAKGALSVIAGEQLAGLLAGGADRESNIVSALVETVTRLVVHELLEAEQSDFLGGRAAATGEPMGRSARVTATNGAGCARRRGSPPSRSARR